MIKNISSIKNDEIKQLTIIIIILILLIIVFLTSYYIKKVKILNLYCPFIILFVFVILVSNIFTLLRINKIEKNPILKNELDNILLNVSSKYFLTNNYIVSYFNDSLIKYDDIVLIYYKTRAMSAHGIYTMMYVVEKNGKVSRFEVSNTSTTIGDEEPMDFKNILLEKNPNILIGLSKNNKEKIFEAYKIKL